MKFSRNGRYLATAGQDMAIRVWEVILNRSELNPSGSVQNDGYIPPDQGEVSHLIVPSPVRMLDGSHLQQPDVWLTVRPVSGVPIQGCSFLPRQGSKLPLGNVWQVL